MAKITPQQVQEISRLIALCNTWVFNGDEVRMIKEAIRHKFNIHALEDLDQDLFYDVLDFAERVQMQIMKATVIINDFKQHAFKQCIMGGAPLTTAIAKKYRQQLDALPPVINWAQMMQDLETAKQAAKAALEAAHV